MPTPKKYLIVVGGPTASGKTGLAIQLAKHFAAPILSADSRQFYTEMEIGNARPRVSELSEAQHYFIADRSVEQALSAGRFAEEALTLLQGLFTKHEVVIAVGGSGLFLKALTEGLDYFPKIAPQTKEMVQAIFEEQGLKGLQKTLKEKDSVYYSKVDLQNSRRMIRALEVCFSGAFNYSHYLAHQKKDRPFVPIYLQPSWPREILYQRINERVHQMVAEGLEEEAQKLHPLKTYKALQTVGYQEWFDHFEGKTTKAEAIALIQQNSRRYAKRQMTWFRRDGYWKLIYQADIRSAMAYIQLMQKEQLEVCQLKGDTWQSWLNENGFQDLGPQKSIIIGLLHSSSTIIRAWGKITQLKKDYWITHWEADNCSPLAQSILLHQLVHAVDCDRIFINDNLIAASFLLQQGWRKENSSNVNNTFVWHRKDVPF